MYLNRFCWNSTGLRCGSSSQWGICEHDPPGAWFFLPPATSKSFALHILKLNYFIKLPPKVPQIDCKAEVASQRLNCRSSSSSSWSWLMQWIAVPNLFKSSLPLAIGLQQRTLGSTNFECLASLAWRDRFYTLEEPANPKWPPKFSFLPYSTRKKSHKGAVRPACLVWLNPIWKGKVSMFLVQSSAYPRYPFIINQQRGAR